MPYVFSNWEQSDEIQLNDVEWFNSEWLETVWKYLQIHFPDDLSKFENLHLLSFGNGSVGRLSKRMPVICETDVVHSGSRLPAELVLLCRGLKVHVLESSEMCKHPEIWNGFIQIPTARGVLTTLGKVRHLYGSQWLVNRFSDASADGKIHFREFIARWISMDEMTGTDVELLRELPMISTVDGSGKAGERFVSLVEVDLAAPRDGLPTIPLPCPRMLLNLSDELSFRLASRLGVRLTSTEDILINIYFPAMLDYWFAECDSAILMKYICDNLQQLDRKVIPLASEVKFLPNRKGILHKPTDLTKMILFRSYSKEMMFSQSGNSLP